MNWSTQPQALFARFAAVWTPPSDFDKIGVAATVKSDALPLHGLRHLPANGTSGWYLWTGLEPLSTAAASSFSIHAIHMVDWRPIVVPYLGLPPGWRFLLHDDYEDVWFDESLPTLERTSERSVAGLVP